MPLWEAMSIYGPHIAMSAQSPIDTEIIVEPLR